MFKRIRQDYWLYGRNPLDRCLWAMVLYRFGQWADESPVRPLRCLGGKLYGALMRLSPIVTGIFLDRRTKLGERFHIVHPGMIVIHPEAVFGDNCGIMHGVTVGENMKPGVPRFGNDVFIGCHATVLGAITVGDGARIAANSLVISDVPAGALAMGVPARIYPNMAKTAEAPPADVRSTPRPSLPATPARGSAFRTT